MSYVERNCSLCDPVALTKSDLYYLDKMRHKKKEWDASSLCEMLRNTYEKAFKVTP